MKRLKTILTSILVFCFVTTMIPHPTVFSAEPASGEITGIQLVKEQFGIDFKFQITPREISSQIEKLEIDGTAAEKVTSKYSVWGSSPKFYVDEASGQVYTLSPSKDTTFTFYGGGNQKLGEFIYHRNTNTFERVAPPENPGGSQGGGSSDTGSQEPPSQPMINIDKIVETPSNGLFDFDPYSVTVTPTNSIEKLDGLEVGTKKYREASSKAAVFGDVFYADRARGKVYFGDRIKTGSVITFKEGDKVLGKFKKVDSRNFEKVETEGLTTKTLHVRLRGNFEAAIVNQKKYDAVSSASGSASINKNSNVVVELAETEKGVQPQESDWKLVKDSSDIHLEFKNTTLNISDKDMGMKPSYNTYDSSVTLSGTPTKAGKFNVTVTVTDMLGRTATSNELPFNVYDLKAVKLIDQLKEEIFKPFEHGAGKLQWDMEPWYIEKFASDDRDEPSQVEVPESLKLWHGSHESGVYGVLGYAVNQNEAPHQTLVIGRGTSLTLKNMKVLSSVNILVKDGGKLNFYDSSLYGRITVENGGKLQMNYDEFKGGYSTGSSINGQVVLKDGAILESSIIYSNANNLTDSSVARRIDEPVIKVMGNVTVNGKVYIRGDESATGTNENGSLFTGQPAMALEEGASLNIPEGSELGIYGGGQFATTSIGGDALILKAGSQVKGDGKLIAVGGTGRALKGGDAVSGTGTINVKEAFLQGGNNFSESTPVGKGYTDAVVINPETVGYAKDGKHNPTTDEEANSPYWRGLKAPGIDGSIANPLDFSNTAGAPRIIKKIEAIPYEIEYVADDTMDKGTKAVHIKGKPGVMENDQVKEPATKEVVKVGTNPTVKTVDIPFETIRINNDTMKSGTEKTKTEGVKGIKEITTTYKIDGEGNVLENQVIEKVTKEKVDKVIEVGTKVIVQNPLEVLEVGKVVFGQPLRIRVSSTPDNLKSVYLDDKLLEKDSQYKVEKGSTILLVDNAVIDNLPEGEHNLTANFEASEGFAGGAVNVMFNAPAKPADDKEPGKVEPKQDDDKRIDSKKDDSKATDNSKKDDVVKKTDGENESKEVKTASTKSSEKSSTPKTGDENNVVVYLGAMVLALGLMQIFRKKT